MAALRMYLESRGVNADRQQLMLERAEQLLSDIQAGE